jgi:hypothetical protein
MTTTPLSPAERTYGGYTAGQIMVAPSRVEADLIAHIQELLSAPAAPREREMDQLTEDFVFEWFGWELMHSREAEDMRTMLKPYFVRALAPSTSGGK